MRRIGMLYSTTRGKDVFVELNYNKYFKIINLQTYEDITNIISETEKKEIINYIQNYIKEGKDKYGRNIRIN